MPTIRQLLDRYGLPPRELALDWAWQIRSHLDRDQMSSAECLLQAHVWTDLEVAADGRLSCDCLDSHSAKAALEDLSHWAGSDAELVPPRRVSPRLARVSERLAYMRLAYVGAAVLLLIVVGAWLFSSTSSDPISPSNNLSTTEASASHSNSVNSEPDSVPTVSQLESLSLVDPGQPVAMDESSSPTDSSSLAQLSVDASIGPPLSPLAAKEQPEPNPVPPVAGELTANPTPSQPEASPPSAEALRDVQQAMQQAEAEESIVPANRSRTGPHDTHGDPWILSRDTMRYRVTVASELKAKARDAQWTLALEPIEGLAVEPPGPVTIQARGLAVWRIYEADAKPPRSCLFVRAVNRGREGQLELVFCGGAEDMPGMSVPLAPKWIEPLTVRVQSQALELRGALARLSTTVITPDQVPAVMQRKQAMVAQMFTSSRLGAIMPEINRLAQLVDGQVTIHAALKSKTDAPALSTWGQLP